MRYCSNCGELILSIKVLRHDTSDRPVEQELAPKYCPYCACAFVTEDMPIKESDTSILDRHKKRIEALGVFGIN